MVLAGKWRYLSGNTANLKTTECSRDTCLKKVLVSFVIFADLDSLISPFLIFLLTLYYFTVQVYKGHSFLDNPQF